MKPGVLLLLIVLTLTGMTAIVAGLWWYALDTQSPPSTITDPTASEDGKKLDKPASRPGPTPEEIDAVRRKVSPDGLLPRYLELFKMSMRRYPRDLRELYEKPEDLAPNEHWGGPYVTGTNTLIDPWKNPYRFQVEGSHNAPGYDLWSVGHDGKTGTADDIGNW